MRKLITILGSCFILTLILSSCGGSEDAKENGEKAGECDCKYFELGLEKYELRDGQLDTYDDGEIDDREKWAELELKVREIDLEQEELELKGEGYRNKQYAGENFHDEDDWEDWLKDFRDARDDHVEDNCEDDQEDYDKARDRYYKSLERKRSEDDDK